MLIRKSFKYEMSHRVVNAYTRRCSMNIHGHSYNLELMFQGDTADNAHMLLDFGLVKRFFEPFVDSFDHAHMHWKTEGQEKEQEYIVANNERWIVTPFSSTAEMQAKMFWTYGTKMLQYLKERGLINLDVFMYSARVFETLSGYAEYRHSDSIRCKFPVVNLNDIEFSEGIRSDWSPEFKVVYQELLKY